MLERKLAQHCAPTLAGIKTGSLFSEEDGPELWEELRRLNGRLAGKGVRLVPLTVREGRRLIYAYRPCMLRKDLRGKLASEILSERGYKTGDPAQCVRHLRERLENPNGFPHEIGLFLGYPPEDVSGFIDKKQCKFVGVWKVYGDEPAARALFERYDRCARDLRGLFESGAPIDRLTAAEGETSKTGRDP